MIEEPGGKGTVKTFAILISAGREFCVYRKIDEVPARLRKKLERSTAGSNAGTVLIADRRGAEELLRANVRALLDRRIESGPRFLGSVRDDLRLVLQIVAAHWRALAAAGLLAGMLWGVIRAVWR